MNMQTIWNKIKLGDSLTNQELDYAIDELTPVANTLQKLGPEFSLAFKEIDQTLLRLKDYQDARRRHAAARQ